MEFMNKIKEGYKKKVVPKVKATSNKIIKEIKNEMKERKKERAEIKQAVKIAKKQERKRLAIANAKRSVRAKNSNFGDSLLGTSKGGKKEIKWI